MDYKLQLKNFVKKNIQKPRLAAAIGTIFIVLILNCYIYAGAWVDFKIASVEADKIMAAGAPDRFMEVRDGIFNEAFRKMWFLSFLIFTSGYFLIIILPDTIEEKNKSVTEPERKPEGGDGKPPVVSA